MTEATNDRWTNRKEFKESYEPARLGGIPVFGTDGPKDNEQRATIRILEDLKENMRFYIDGRSYDLNLLNRTLSLLIMQLEA